MMRRQFLAAAAAATRTRSFDVTEAGAQGDGRSLSTPAIQKTIDACSQAGGGTVYFPPGRFLSGTLVLRDHVRLFLDAGAVLAGSTNLADYPLHVPALRSFTDTYTNKSLIYAEKAVDVAIEGRGTIDGQGAAFKGPYMVRPYMLRFIECHDVAVTDITIRDSPMWVQHYLACDNVALRGLTVHSLVNQNNDGIDIDCCDRVRISDCDIRSGDDAIVLKSTAARPCRRVTITNCVLSTLCNALKMGTESNGGFEDVVVSNCTVYDTRLAGIALEIVDGGAMDRVSFSNITMNGVGAPIFIRLGDRGRPFVENGPRQPTGTLRNVILTGIQAARAGRTGCAIAGLPGHLIERLTLENLRLEFDGGGKKRETEVPEVPDKYPEFKMFGELPAYGLYFRHARGVRLRNIELSTAKPDPREAMVFDDASDIRKDRTPDLVR
jgi:polygalacturonase